MARNLKNCLRSAIAEFPELLLVIVYGSFAKGKETANSDLDIAVAGKKPLSTKKRIEVALHLSEAFQREVDLVDLRRAHGLILKEILTQGKVILSKDPLLYAAIMKRYLFDQADFMPLYHRLLKIRREKFIHEK